MYVIYLQLAPAEDESHNADVLPNPPSQEQHDLASNAEEMHEMFENTAIQGKWQ